MSAEPVAQAEEATGNGVGLVRAANARPRRSRSAHRAILQATLELLADVGYHSLTIEGVAAQAAVGKATIYRWWPSKGLLVSEALISTLDVSNVPHSDSVVEDLYSVMRTTIHNYAGTIAGHVVPSLIADLMHDPELVDAFRRDFLSPRRAAAAVVLRRAIDEGALPPDADLDLIMDIWGGTAFYRALLTGGTTDDDVAVQLVDHVLAAPPRLGQVPD